MHNNLKVIDSVLGLNHYPISIRKLGIETVKFTIETAEGCEGV